jgi:hypothetical protein
MNKAEEAWMNDWVKVVYPPTKKEDFWIETPIGLFKNPVFHPEPSDLENEINLTITYDEYKKN